MADPNIQQPVQHRSACAECQRRKQKCNRQWPCNQCQKRKVASKCAFSHSETSSVAENRATGSTSQKRSADFEDDDNDNDSLGEDDDIDADAFSKMGYMAGSLVSDLLSKTVISKTESPRPPSQTLTLRTSSECPALESALAALPQRPQMDTLVQIFFNTVNYHYYIIYPPVFLDQYQKWWDARLGSQPLSIEWTALLVIICSVTTQHLDADTRAKIETEMGDSVDNLSVSYLDLTRNLSTAIPIGSYHILNIQRMLHTIYWFKSEARFPEAYLLISEAVGEATELGLHIEARAAGLPEFDREIRRRVWCVLDTWDWQFASGLARPTLIDHGTSSVAQPTLSLEEFTPSPLLHMKLQSEAIALLASRFQAPKNVVTPKDIQEYKGILETWIRNFPAVYSTTQPDESKDYGSQWITHHRFYLHTMAYLMILNPIRRYLAQTFSPETPQEEHAIRKFGVDYSLLNLETTTEWAKVASHRDGRFHFIIFSLFDTVAVLSAAILNDKDNSIPRRTEIIDAIDEALITLKKIYNLSKTAKQSYDILSQLVRRIPRRRSAQSKRKRFGEVPQFVAGQAYGAPALIQDPTVYLKPSSLSSDTTTSPPSQFSSSESAESGSTPQSNHIPTPEYQPAYLEPQVQEPLAPAYPTVQQPCNMDAHYAAHHAQALGQSQQLLYMNPAHVSPASLQSHNPQPQRPVDIFTGIPAADGHIHPMPFEPINDDVMGDFSMLWNWRSLNLPFISSQIPLPGQTD